jgi:hypothetical protein
MIEWFNCNASAIQALASIVGVATTIVLVAVTARYVKLTTLLAEAS